jgi:hypothetical protein
MIATHAPKKATHAPRESAVNVIRANFLVCIANSFEPIRKFLRVLGSSRLSPFANTTIMQDFKGGIGF